MPRASAGEIDVDVIFIRNVRPEHLENVDFGRGCRARLSFAFLVGLERTLVGMRLGVRFGDAFDGRVCKDYRAVASREIAAIEAFAEEEGVVEGEIVVGGV
jgi:hypothetical protein